METILTQLEFFLKRLHIILEVGGGASKINNRLSCSLDIKVGSET